MSLQFVDWFFAALFILRAVDAAYQKLVRVRTTTERNLPNEVTLQRDIITRHKNPYTGTPCSPQSQLEARTLPNRRLQNTFGIDNAFTTQDIRIANAFKSAARTKLRDAVKITKKTTEDGIPVSGDTDAQWHDMVLSIDKIVSEELYGANEIINLAELVQFVTLKISLLYLFNPTEEALSNRKAVKYIAKTTNILWIQSKSSGPNNTNTWQDEHRLHHHLHNLTGLLPTNPLHNPMNFILPAYETMWRAVLRGLLEIYFRDAENSHTWQDILHEFRGDSGKNVFRGDDRPDVASALDIVKEVLRLYPPTRRVNRQFPDDPSNFTRSADIEWCHRTKLLVPSGDPQLFRPERWLQIKKDFLSTKEATEHQGLGIRNVNETESHKLSNHEESLGYMPFALSCPAGGRATQGLGFKMIALLISTLCAGLDDLNRRSIDSGAGDNTVTSGLLDDGHNTVRVVGTTRATDIDTKTNIDINIGTHTDTNSNMDTNLIHSNTISTSTTRPNPILISSPHPSIPISTSYSPSTKPPLLAPNHQSWKLHSESPQDDLPPIGTALGSERSDYLSLVYRRVI